MSPDNPENGTEAYLYGRARTSGSATLGCAIIRLQQYFTPCDGQTAWSRVQLGSQVCNFVSKGLFLRQLRIPPASICIRLPSSNPGRSGTLFDPLKASYWLLSQVARWWGRGRGRRGGVKQNAAKQVRSSPHTAHPHTHFDLSRHCHMQQLSLKTYYDVTYLSRLWTMLRCRRRICASGCISCLARRGLQTSLNASHGFAWLRMASHGFAWLRMAAGSLAMIPWLPCK